MHTVIHSLIHRGFKGILKAADSAKLASWNNFAMSLEGVALR
jgi:hypothetical protein